MSLWSDPTLVGVLVGALVLAGAINGLAGFGFALIGTMTLASLIDPATAVVFMIVPIMAVNVSLARELGPAQLRACWGRFWPLLLAALVGTIIGMVALDRLPGDPLRILLGLVTLGFVAASQRAVPIPLASTARERCFVESPAGMVGVGSISGLLFGGTNVGVQLVAYLRSCNLSHAHFVGVVGMVFLGLNGVRILIAAGLSLYADTAMVLLSLAAIIPALAGVVVGRRIRHRIAPNRRRWVVLAILALIGIRLVLGGTGVA